MEKKERGAKRGEGTELGELIGGGVRLLEEGASFVVQ